MHRCSLYLGVRLSKSYFPETRKKIPVLRVHSRSILGFMFCGILRVLAVFRYSVRTAYTAILAVFRGSILWNTAVLSLSRIWGFGTLEYCLILEVSRDQGLLILWLAFINSAACNTRSISGFRTAKCSSTRSISGLHTARYYCRGLEYYSKSSTRTLKNSRRVRYSGYS